MDARHQRAASPNVCAATAHVLQLSCIGEARGTVKESKGRVGRSGGHELQAVQR